MKRTIWLARHGNRLDFVYPEWFNLAARRYDPPLAEDGFWQAEKLAEYLKAEKIEHIFSSPFLRAIQTAHPLAKILDIPLKIEAGLGEWLNPEWMTEYPHIHPPYLLEREYPYINWDYQSYLIPEYPESAAQVQNRTALTVRYLVEDFSGNLLLVGHSASVLGATVGLVGGNPELKLAFAALVKLVQCEEQWEIELDGDTSYLE
jgi:broad specificity phosphatase PhoE